MQNVSDIPAPPPRPGDAHKGTFGTVVVVGGCATMPGAPALCARAAFRSGAGLVKIATDAASLSTTLSMLSSATGIALSGDTESRRAEVERRTAASDVLAIGPGWGPATDHASLLNHLLELDRSTVLDADGLNVLAQTGVKLADTRRKAPLILTPHPGEFRRLAEAIGIEGDPTDPNQRPALALRLAEAHAAVVVLKGRHTVVADAASSIVFTNTTGNPALATAGTGDVLTGLTAGLLAQGLPAFDAARRATHVHGRAADRWADTHGRAGLLAEELADAIPDALHALRA